MQPLPQRLDTNQAVSCALVTDNQLAVGTTGGLFSGASLFVFSADDQPTQHIKTRYSEILKIATLADNTFIILAQQTSWIFWSSTSLAFLKEGKIHELSGLPSNLSALDASHSEYAVGGDSGEIQVRRASDQAIIYQATNDYHNRVNKLCLGNKLLLACSALGFQVFHFDKTEPLFSHSKPYFTAELKDDSLAYSDEGHITHVTWDNEGTKIQHTAYCGYNFRFKELSLVNQKILAATDFGRLTKFPEQLDIITSSPLRDPVRALKIQDGYLVVSYTSKEVIFKKDRTTCYDIPQCGRYLPALIYQQWMILFTPSGIVQLQLDQ